MKKSAIIALAGLAGLVGLTGCVPGGVHPNGPAISGVTWDVGVAAAQGHQRATALKNQAVGNQTVYVPQSEGQQNQLETCYKVLNEVTGRTEVVFPLTDSGAIELDNYLTAQFFKDRQRRKALSIENGRVLGIYTGYIDENGKLIEEIQNFVKR